MIWSPLQQANTDFWSRFLALNSTLKHKALVQRQWIVCRGSTTQFLSWNRHSQYKMPYQMSSPILYLTDEWELYSSFTFNSSSLALLPPSTKLNCKMQGNTSGSQGLLRSSGKQQNKSMEIQQLNEKNWFLSLQMLGASMKFQRTNVSFVMSVHLSTWNNLNPMGQIFVKFYIGKFY